MSKIEWTDVTWNPVVGCSAVSPGCDHCYAAVVASWQMQPAHQGLTIGRQWNGTVRLLPERLDEPLRWRKPRRVFVCSMSDLFHRAVPEGFIVDVWTTMAMAPQHSFQVLTKRPKRMAHRLSRPWFDGDVEMGLGLVGYGRHVDWQSREYPEAGDVRWLPNVWLGTSIESDRYAYRADHLRATPAAVRFLSLEPLLGALPSLDLTGIGWVIVGGESGPGARPMHPNWVRDIRDRCVAAGVPFFFKQWGAWRGSLRWDDDTSGLRDAWVNVESGESGDEDTALVGGTWQRTWRMGKTRAGRELDGRTWDEYPTVHT